MAVGSSWIVRLRQWLERWPARVERLISGPPQDDPLYLTNRTWGQKLKLILIAAAPVLLIILLVAAAATDWFRFHKVDPYEHPVDSAPAASNKRLPDPKLTPADLEVVNIKIAKDARGQLVTGEVRNNTNQKVDSAEVSYYLADSDGSLVGTDTTDVANVAPHGSVTFRMPLKIAKASYVIVRDVHLN